MTEQSAFRKAAFFTLGCKLNFTETSTLARSLEERGIMRAAPGESPDICVVNTCSVTQMADKKARHLVRNLHSRWPGAAIVVTGCYAQLKPDEAAELPGVDIVLGNAEKGRFAEFLDRWLADRKPVSQALPTAQLREFTPSCERGDRTRWWLKVQDGCDYFCSYCTIPFARGRSRSPRIADLVEQARRAAGEGAKEIVLTGVNVGDFGNSHGETFFGLVRALDKVEGIERFRISSIEPNLLEPDLIRWAARESRAFMPHFHLPLQSGSDAVLKMMRRRYDTALFAERVALIRQELPEAFIGVDVIAGARGETPQEWERSLDFIGSLDVTRLHVFPYSERPGTLALRLSGPVAPADRHARAAKLGQVSEQKFAAFLKARRGEMRPVLWEGRAARGMMHGLTDNYVRVEAPFRADSINTVETVRLGDPDPMMTDTLTLLEP